jgi:hypothetical protein
MDTKFGIKVTSQIHFFFLNMTGHFERNNTDIILSTFTCEFLVIYIYAAQQNKYIIVGVGYARCNFDTLFP